MILLKHGISARFSAAFCVFMAFAVSACLPTSENPLPVSPTTPLDRALLGSWIGELADEDEPVLLNFIETANQKTMAILINIATPEDSESGWAEFEATSANLTNGTYLNLFWTENDGEAVEDLQGYHLMRYEIDDEGTLLLFFIDHEILSEAIEDGELAGEILSTGLSKTARVTASTEDLATYVESQDAALLFPEFYGAFKPAI